MRLEIRDIAKVDSAVIDVDSISVVAGYNGSGKTTISKCLYGMLEIEKGNVDIDRLKKLFSNKMVTLGKQTPESFCRLSYPSGYVSVDISDKAVPRVEKYGEVESVDAVYLRAPSRWSDPFSDNLSLLLERPSMDEANDLLKGYINILKEYAGGQLVKSGDRYNFIDDDFPGSEIAMDYTASGLMIFLELSRLISNGSIKAGSVLIIDEPETNLHPEKQVALAKVLVRLAKEFGIRMFLSSHNIYFIRALEVAISEEELDCPRFYSMVKDSLSKLYKAMDVSDNIEEIYSELYKPLEEL